MNLLKTLLVAVAVTMAGVAAWLLYLAVTLGMQGGENVELADLPQPSAELTWQEVLQIQLDALKHNDELDTGIATAFNFASPANRRNYITPQGDDEVTMLRFFARMLHAPRFRFILNHASAELGPDFIREDEVRQVVTLTSRDGEEVNVLFVLRRQTESPYEGCWMTEGVGVISRRPPPEGDDEPVVEA